MAREERAVARTVCRVLAAGGLALLAGCTLLIPFDEVDPTADGGSDGSILPPRDGDVGDTAITDAAASNDGGVIDATATNPDACVGHGDGKYCGGDQITWPSKDDLVTCAAHVVSLVRNCNMGQGCVGMLNGFPDECDECFEKVDGTYCGRDFTNWDPANAQQRIRCQSGRIVGSVLCTTCKSMGVASFCE